MEGKLKKQAIDLFVAQYGVTPEKYGYPVIEVCSKQREFLFGKDKDVVEARLTELKLQKFFEKAYLMPAVIIAVDMVLMVFMFVFPQFMPQFRNGIWFLSFLLLCWGGVLYCKWLKLQEAREKSQEGLIEIFY